MTTRALFLSICGLWACSSADRTPASTPEGRSLPRDAAVTFAVPKQEGRAPAAEPAMPAVVPAARADVALRADDTPGPARTCLQLADELVAAGAEDLAIASNARGSTLLTVEAGRTSVTAYTLAGSSFSQVFAHKFEHAVKALSLVAPASGPAVVAWVDARAGLATAQLSGAGFEHVQHIADSVDTRFQPALSHTQPLLLAYTRAVGEAMHSFVAVERGPAFAPSVDVTPLGHGAAAPTFVAGSEKPLLYVIDARAGLSPLLEVAFEGARPLPAVVRTPVSQPATPPLLRAFTWRGAEIHVAYTAIGKLAASAIGHVVSTRSDAPTAVVPSFGYGELHMDALARADSALLAVEMPDDLPVTATRHLELVQLDSRGEGPHFRLSAPAASRPQLARGAGDEVLLGYLGKDGVHVARLRCGR